MKTRKMIKKKLDEASSAVWKEALGWVLEPPDCLFCALEDKREVEINITNNEMTPSYIEAKHGWKAGTVHEHMEYHTEYDSGEARHMEQSRKDTIDTLAATEDIVGRLQQWLDEMEIRKAQEGEITDDWVASAARLVGQANSSLKLIGQLKKEIGVDSQLLLAQRRVDGILGILAEVLLDHPLLLDRIENRLVALRTPIAYIDYDVVDDQ
tara:strand:- start:345 stop:974 length:630 start_codon:yes stop_codon:yes gene_type:complete